MKRCTQSVSVQWHLILKDSFYKLFYTNIFIKPLVYVIKTEMSKNFL